MANFSPVVPHPSKTMQIWHQMISPGIPPIVPMQSIIFLAHLLQSMGIKFYTLHMFALCISYQYNAEMLPYNSHGYVAIAYKHIP